MQITHATNQQEWDDFLMEQEWSPFLQSWTMGDVFADINQQPIRLEVRENDQLIAICFGHVVRAKRGAHIAIPYGPIIAQKAMRHEIMDALIREWKTIAAKERCSFLRMSPLWKEEESVMPQGAVSSPLHLLAEELWLLDLKNQSKESIMANMRKTTRNLIRRAEKEGVTIERSAHPDTDITHFFTLYDETRKRHGFTPYSNAFVRTQLAEFSNKKQATLYLAWYNNEVVASSVHMHCGGETSYHHGASTHKYPKIPASYLLQWTAICDALQRGDHVYNFWGIAPEGAKKSHPFQGVTTFKTGFGGERMHLQHCLDIPVSWKYHCTRAFEFLRKWRRGF